ncbi:MAG: hypothetical protein K6F52_02680 [Clostridia bacterium]|nr:hypothetical protein [Clostridia bacterium]
MRNYVLSIIVLLGVLTLILSGTGAVSSRADDEGAKVLEDAIRRTTVQCYAVEGAYPPSVAYLVDNYGIQIDPEKYYVFYEGFASNIMPQITVVREKESDEEL